MKQVILCADDYGQNPAISQAVINLLQHKRLSATSCMVNSDFWTLQAPKLKSFKDQAYLGLHLNLTEGRALSASWQKHYGENFIGLGQLLVKTFLQRFKPDIIMAEIHAQLDRFIERIGALPDFIDGHQHVHHFPQIRDALLAVYQQRLRSQRGCFIRNVAQHKSFWYLGSPWLKKIIIEMSGANLFEKCLQKEGIPHNSSFCGIYDFKKSKKYSELFDNFLAEIQPNGLIMCHPGLPETRTVDPIATARGDEYNFFNSELFLQKCAKYQVKIDK